MNIYDIPKGGLENELVETLLQNKNVKIERIVSSGHTTDWQDQDVDEWVCLLSGEAMIDFGDNILKLSAGDTLLIPKHQKHRVAKTTQCVWLCVFIG